MMENQICSLCGEENSIGAKICANCGCYFGHLALEKVDSDNNWKIVCPVCKNEYFVSEKTEKIEMCKYCYDDEDKRKIANCNAVKVSKRSKDFLVLFERRTKKKIEILEDGIIGREGDIDQDFFSTNMYISSEHCRVTNEKGQWKIEHLSRTNRTLINGINLLRDTKMTIKNNDVLRLSNLVFDVRLVSNNVETIDNQLNSEVSSDGNEGNWIIQCPVCGKTYNGNDSNFRIRECNGCLDEFDKYEIARIRAKRR